MNLLNKYKSNINLVVFGSIFVVFLCLSLVAISDLVTKLPSWLTDIFFVPILEPRERFILEIQIVMMIANPMTAFMIIFGGINFYANLILIKLSQNYTFFKEIKSAKKGIWSTVLFRSALFLVFSTSTVSTSLFFLPQIIKFLQSF